MFNAPRRTSVTTSSVTTATTPARSPRRLRRLVAAFVAGGISLGLMAGFTQSAAAFTPAQMANLVIHEINLERQANHLPPLRGSYRLNAAAAGHNAVMARANVMSHQLSGESSLGTRISRTGFPWTFCAENVAWTSVRSTPGVIAVHRAMYNEKAPNNGHRLNILSRNVNQVGVSVIIDNAHGKLWVTEDFARVA